MPQHQGGHKALFLLPVQPFESAVVFLRDPVHREDVVLQPLPGGGEVDHRERQQKHPLIPGLQVGQQLGGVLGKGDQVGREDVGVIPGAHRLALFLHFHLADVGELAFHRFDGLELIHRLNVHGDGQLRVQLQNFRQQLVRELRRHDLQIGRSAPILPHPEQAGLPEVKAVRGDIVLGAQAGLGDVPPGKAERLPAAGVHLAVEQSQPPLAVQGLRGHAQPLEVAHHVGLHPLQTGPGLADPIGGQAKGDVLGTLDPVV